MAEREGFEPPEPLGSPDFESGRLNQTPEPLRARHPAFPFEGVQSSKPARWRARRDAAISIRVFGKCLVAATIAILLALAPRVGADSADLDANVGYFAKPRYIGSVYCYACHLDLSREFAKTKMGRLFQVKPRNDLERRGCEGCHGPGSNHAITGGGVGIGGLVEFRIDRGQSIETANRACMNCHDEAFWHGATHGARQLACFDCHLVMTQMSRTSQLAPPYVVPWNNRRTWGFATGGGILAGIFTGAVFRRRRRIAREGSRDEPA